MSYRKNEIQVDRRAEIRRVIQRPEGYRDSGMQAQCTTNRCARRELQGTVSIDPTIAVCEAKSVRIVVGGRRLDSVCRFPQNSAHMESCEIWVHGQ